MKIRNLFVVLVLFTAFFLLALSNAQAGRGRNRGVVADECQDCADAAVVGQGGYGHRAGGGILSNGSHRPFAAPVYFGNAFPEYTLGSPNIYAGYEEDTVLVTPVRGKGPFHYPYWNKMYNGNPYYGKNWDQNWTVFGENGYYGNAQYWRTRQFRAPAGYPGYRGGKGVGISGIPQSGSEQVYYEDAPQSGAYQGHYIANFDDFCCMPCDEKPVFPFLSRVKAFFGCALGCNSCPPCFYDPYCDPCYDDGCGLCEGFCDPCAGFVCPPLGDPCCDPCAGIAFGDDSCCGGDIGMVQDSVVVESDAAQSGTADSEPVSGLKTDDPTVKAPVAPTPVAPLNYSSDVPANNASAPAPQSAPANNFSTPVPSAIPNIPGADSLLPSPNAPATGAPTTNAPATGAPAPAGGTGYLQMTVPEDSIVYINGYQTKMTGTERRFAARHLEPGVSYRFEIKVVTRQNGETLTDTQTAVLLQGTTMNVAFHFNGTNRQVALNSK